jgi:hypothetical protein
MRAVAGHGAEPLLQDLSKLASRFAGLTGVSLDVLRREVRALAVELRHRCLDDALLCDELG